MENFKLKSGIFCTWKTQGSVSYLELFQWFFPSPDLTQEIVFSFSEKEKKIKERKFFQYMHLVSSMWKEILFYLHSREGSMVQCNVLLTLKCQDWKSENTLKLVGHLFLHRLHIITTEACRKKILLSENLKPLLQDEPFVEDLLWDPYDNFALKAKVYSSSGMDWRNEVFLSLS